MKLEKVREEVYYFSQKASEANQLLSIAGIGLIWLFKVNEKTDIIFPPILFGALTLFIFSLLFEIIHYSILSPMWSCYYKSEYERIKTTQPTNPDIEQTEVDQPQNVNVLGWCLFYLKLAFSMIGYILFFVYTFKHIILK